MFLFRFKLAKVCHVHFKVYMYSQSTRRLFGASSEMCSSVLGVAIIKWWSFFD